MPRVVPAVARALEVLGLLQNSSTISVPVICKCLGLPRSTAHELVNTLIAGRFLAPVDNAPHRFTLGLRIFELGSAYAKDMDLIREGTVVTSEIAVACKETTMLGVLDGNEVVLVVKADSTHPVRFVSAVGSRLPAHVTAHGKVLLSALSDDEVGRLYGEAESLRPSTQNSICSAERLLAELSRVRRDGVAFDNCESDLDIWAVAAPVRNQHHCVAAAIGVAVPVTRMNTERATLLSELVKKAGNDLSLRLGYSGLSRRSQDTHERRTEPPTKAAQRRR